MSHLLVLTAGFGEGHNTAARGLADAAGRHPDLTASVHDCVLESYGSLGEFARKAYLGTINRAPRLWQAVYDLVDRTDMISGNLGALGKLADTVDRRLAESGAAAVASTYPLYAYLLERIFTRDPARRIPVITVVTDSISINTVWTKGRSDWFLVPNAETAEVVQGQGVEPGRVRVTGFPVSPAFADHRAKRPAPPPGPPWRVLYMVNSGKRQAPALASALSRREDIRLTVTAGRDEDLRAAIEKATREARADVDVLGWTSDMPRLMCSSHLLIGKAGGATVQEALAAALPLIVTRTVPGQEEGNAELITRNACGAVAGSEEAVPDLLDAALADRAARLAAWREAAARFSRPGAALDIIEFIAERISNP